MSIRKPPWTAISFLHQTIEAPKTRTLLTITSSTTHGDINITPSSPPHLTYLSTTSKMPTYFYCCQCGDGPLNTEYVTACPRCYHDRCGGCNTDSHDYYADNHAHNTASRHNNDYLSTTTQESTRAPNPIYAHSHTHAHADSTTNFPASGIAPFSERPERQPVWCWQCCACGGSNYVKTDAGCANCCNHWKGKCCQVYDGNAR
jgi:hypothetical protein